MICLDQLQMAYGKQVVLQAVSLAIPSERFIALLGNNGSGKSSFLKLIDGSERPSFGQIQLAGESVVQLPDRAKKMALVTSGRSAGMGLYVREILEMGRYPHVGAFGKLSPSDHQKIAEIAAKCSISKWLDRPIGQLSDGEYQKVMIARALIQETPYLLLDEPTSFLDVKQRNWLFQELKRWPNKTILMATHDVQEALVYCDAFLLFQDRNLFYFDGKSAALITALNKTFETEFNL